MSNLEILLTDVGETATKELAKKYNPKGLKENKEIVRDLKDIILDKDNITKEVVKEIKKQTVSDVMKENDLENKMVGKIKVVATLVSIISLYVVAILIK